MYNKTLQNKISETVQSLSGYLWLGVVLLLFVGVNVQKTEAAISITGTLYESDGVTLITSGKTVVAAIGTSTPSLHATTSDGSGNFRIEGIATSSGGTTWTARSAVGDNDAWSGVVYGNGLFVAVGNSGDRIMTSPDGITWTARTAPENNGWADVAYGNGIFAAVSSDGTNRVMTSPDGITWTARSAASAATWVKVIYADGQFVAITDQGITNAVMTSPDGITWTGHSVPLGAWFGLTYGNGTYVAVSYNANRVMTSPDGITWTARSAVGDNDLWSGVTYGNGTFVAVGESGDYVMTSPDGITWTGRTQAESNTWWYVTYANDLFVAVAQSGTNRVMTSPDGITWTAVSAVGNNDQWHSVVYGNGLFVAVSGSGDRVMTAPAGFGENTPITLFLDGETEDATTITYGLNTAGTINDIELQDGVVQIWHPNATGTINLADADFYDADDDADILFDSDTGTTTISGILALNTNVTLLAPQHLDVSGILVLLGNFEHEQGEVLLTGGDQTILTTATTTFYTLTAEASSARTLTFTSGQEYVFEDTLTLTGADGQLTSLDASTPGTEYYFRPNATATVDYLDVQDSHNISATTTPIDCSANCVDGGNTSGWTFPVVAVVWNATDWTTYDTITIDSSQVDDDLTDFPVYVDLTDLSANFWSTTPSASTTVGTDIRVTTDDGSPTELPRELVAASSTAQTGELHFKADSISSTTDTVFRIYYSGTTTGDYATDASYGAENVWTNDYVAVWHMGDTVFDSTGNSTSTVYGTTASTTAKMGTGRSFNGTSDYIQTNLTHLKAVSDTTVSFWTNVPDKDLEMVAVWEGEIAGNGENRSGEEQMMFGYRGAGGGEFIAIIDGDYDDKVNQNDGIVAGVNQFYTSSFTDLETDSADMAVYIDGALGDSRTTNFIPFRTAYDTNLRIGRPGTAENYYAGVMDELRISSSTRSAAWINSQYINQATTTDFYNVSVNETLLTLSNHDAGQVSNVFSFMNETDTELFAFKLSSTTESAAVEQLVVRLEGANKFTATDLTAVELYVDVDNDAVYDEGTDTLVSAGSVTVSGQSGTIVFASDFSVSGAVDYLVIGDTVSIQRGGSVTFALYAADVTGESITASGTVSSIQHVRGSSGGGSYKGGGGEVGGDAPAGDGDVGGGTNEGGELIGNDPNYSSPTAHSGSWNNAANAYDDTDGTYATTAAAVASNYSNHGFFVPGSNQIDGIAIKIETSGTTAAGNIGIELSWDGGTSWTSSGNSTPTLTTTDVVAIVGGVSDTWGRSWSGSEFSNANFAVRLTGNPSSNTVQVDAIQVRVYHTATGGGGGGGGVI